MGCLASKRALRWIERRVFVVDRRYVEPTFVVALFREGVADARFTGFIPSLCFARFG